MPFMHVQLLQPSPAGLVSPFLQVPESAQPPGGYVQLHLLPEHVHLIGSVEQLAA